MEVAIKTKYIYKKRNKENYFKSNISLEKTQKIKEIFKNYLLCEKREELKSILTSKNYIEIYNYFFLVKHNKEYIEIHSFINEQLIELINKKIKSEEGNKNEIEKIINIINYIDIIEKKIKNIKNLFTTSVSRFNSELIKSMNDKLNVFFILNQTNNDFTKFIEQSEQVFLSRLFEENDEKEKQKIINSISQFIKIIKIVSNQKKIDSFYEKIFEIINKKGKYYNIYKDSFNKLFQMNDINNIHSDLITDYFDSITREIEKDYVFFQKIFGEKEAIKFKEKIIQIYIFDKFIKEIFKNEKLLKITILEKKYDILKLIESKTKHSLKLTRDFVNSVFDLLLKEYQNQIILPKDKMNIKEGIKFIEQMLLKIKELNNIFKEVFNQNIKVNLKFHETLLKLISSKNLETLEYFLSIYVNENIYKDNIRNNLLLDKSFIQLLSNRNNKEMFFNYYRQYIIRRISNNNFNLDIELSFEKFLKNNIENRYMNQVNRLFKDIDENKFINEHNSQNYFYLFSYEALDDQYDLIQIIDLSKDNQISLNPFRPQMDIYNAVYPKRKIKLSQILSSIEVSFLNKYNLLLNYIQWYILEIISNEKTNNYSITYEKLASIIPYKPENRIYLKLYINSLIEMKILTKESKNPSNNDINLDDILKINFNFECKNPNNSIICFNKPNSLLKGMIKKMISLEKDKVEKEKDDFNKNYKIIAIKENARFIIDCVIMQITKALPNGEKISEKDLIITTVKHKLINDLHLSNYKVVDYPFIKQRISSLVERDLIKFHENESVPCYSYC